MKQVYIIAATMFLVDGYNVAAQSTQVKQTKQLKTANQKENDFGGSVLKALQNKGLEAWIALFPTNEEYRGILQKGLSAKAEGLTQEKIDQMMLRREKEAVAAYAAQFKKYQGMADSAGIVWKDAVLEKFDFSPVYPEPIKLKYLEATLWFRCRNRHFAIDGIQAVEIKSGYKLQALATIMRVDDAD